MSNVNEYVLRCARELCGVACVERARFTRLELRSSLNPELVNVAIVVTPLNDTSEAKISGRTAAGELRENAVASRDWQRLAELIVEALPSELFDEPVLHASFTGEWPDGRPVASAHGDSASDTIVLDHPAQEATMQTLTTTPGVENLFNLAVTTAIDFVAAGDTGTAQVCVRGKNFPTWVTVGHSVDRQGARNGLYAQTNDMDLMVGIPPTLYAHATDPAQLKDKVLEYLRKEYAGVSNVTVQVFRRPVCGHEPVLTGNSDTGTLAEQPEFPSL